jgi:excinuclease UvrABC ATPase subunit
MEKQQVIRSPGWELQRYHNGRNDRQESDRKSSGLAITYIKAFDEIRNLFSDLPLARQRSFKPSHFSFNVEGGQ